MSVALVASLGVNVYLLRGRDSPEASVSPSAGSGTSPTSSSSVPAAVAKGTMSPVVRAARKRYVDLDRDALELRLVDAEAKIHLLLPLHERFEVESRIPEHEDMVRPFLDKVFGGADKYELECRETTCHMVPSKDANANWVAVVQQSEDGIGLFAGMMFSGNEMWGEVLEPGSSVTRKAMSEASGAIYAAESVKQCWTQFRATSALELELSFDVATRTFVVEEKGTTSDLGGCVVRAAQAVVAKIAIPHDAAVVGPMVVGF